MNLEQNNQFKTFEKRRLPSPTTVMSRENLSNSNSYSAYDKHYNSVDSR